jgi:hypothetical protein
MVSPYFSKQLVWMSPYFRSYHTHPHDQYFIDIQDLFLYFPFQELKTEDANVIDRELWKACGSGPPLYDGR